MESPPPPTICSLKSLRVFLPNDIQQHIQQQYLNDTTRVQQILQAMKLPPATTTCRVNWIRGSRTEIQQELETELSNRKLSQSFRVEPHVELPDVLCIHSTGKERANNNLNDQTKPFIHANTNTNTNTTTTMFEDWPERERIGWPMHHRAIIVDRFCGEAVLRGSHVFVRGILAADKGIQQGETIAVYAHVRPHKKTPKRGSSLEYYDKEAVCVYLGLGISQCKRTDYFRLDKGIGVQMVLHPDSTVGPLLPPISGILPSKIFFQNLPSIVVAHALAPEEGQAIIDLCCAPGGKSSHVASLVRNNATIIACDKSRSKMLAVQEMFRRVGATCITPLALDSTNCVIRNNSNNNRQSVQEILESASRADDGLLNISGFPPESFDRVLLDPPCSAMGLRPKLQIVHKGLKELQQVCMYQQKFIREAEALLKPGGIMTYSTCTFLADENERMVRYVLDEFPSLELMPVLIETVGGPGLEGMGLDERERNCLRRFDPLPDQGGDTIGFFVAKFRKKLPG